MEVNAIKRKIILNLKKKNTLNFNNPKISLSELIMLKLDFLWAKLSLCTVSFKTEATRASQYWK